MNSDTHELEIVSSWLANAEPWSKAIRTAAIASRRLITNQAIIDAVASVSPRRVLDVGCGEGWLARALHDRGMGVVGVDAVPELIATARSLGGGEFHVQDYASLARQELGYGAFDATVCNFSLLGNESVALLIAALPRYLRESGSLIIQTLHPESACGDNPYRDGWRPGSWQGFGEEFSTPAPWYFRTTPSWLAMLQDCGFEIVDCREPAAAPAVPPASIIWICKKRSVQR